MEVATDANCCWTGLLEIKLQLLDCWTLYTYPLDAYMSLRDTPWTRLTMARSLASRLRSAEALSPLLLC